MLVAALLNIAVAGPASASANCPSSSHCYSLLRGTGTTFYGAYGTWARTYMKATGASTTNKQWMNSEMWAVNGSAWVETGLTQGYLAPAGGVGYYAYAAYMTTGGTYREHSFGKVTQNASTTDEYQISRGPSTNVWNVYFDGTLFRTPSVGFWTVPRIDMGGEVNSTNASANTFTMYAKGINSSGSRVNLGTETTSVNSQLNGSRPADSTWKWSTK